MDVQFYENKEDLPKVIILLGGPGSGKGTQGDRIETEYGFIHLSMGDILRSKKDEPEVVEYTKELTSSKKSKLTHELSLRLLENKMKENGWSKEKFVLDGFHRKFDIYDQQFLNKINLITVIVLTPSSINILEERIKKRSAENENKESFREYDIEKMEKRLKIYQTETQDVIKYFRNILGEKVYEVNSDNSKDIVYSEIKKIIDCILN